MLAHSEPRLLIVDDNDIDVLVVERLLKRLKLKLSLVRARNGEEALAMLMPDSDKPILVPPFTMIVDINMPRMNGFELLDEIIEHPMMSQVSIYIQSSSDNPRDRTRAKNYPIQGYVVKPVTEPILLEIAGQHGAA